MNNTTARHRVRRTVTESGFAGRCSCGWATTRRTRQLRDRDVDTHEISAEPTR